MCSWLLEFFSEEGEDGGYPVVRGKQRDIASTLAVRAGNAVSQE
jgi:hypothetical protein